MSFVEFCPYKLISGFVCKNLVEASIKQRRDLEFHCLLLDFRFGPTLALAEPEDRLYNHQPDRPPGANVSIGYISAISQRIELKFCMIVI